MEFRVLGQVEVFDGDRRIPIPATRVRALLAILLLRPNQAVAADELIDALWADDGDLPANPRMALHTYVSRLRAKLGPDGRQMVRTESGGYRITVEADQLDLLRFRAKVREAAAGTDAQTRVAKLSAALELWHGEPLSGVPAGPLVRDSVAGLVEERLRVIEELVTARLDAGQHGEVIPDLATLVAQHPLREHLWALLMLALYQSGRQADALDAYQQVRTALRDQLGADPGAELQETHRAVLARDPALLPPLAEPDRVGRETVLPPRQLPADIDRFVGRERDLAALDAMLPDDRSGDRPLVIAAVDGVAGVGKTALAIHWAHRVQSRFPDGQLYLNLRGYGSGQPMEKADAVATLLVSLGVVADQIPDGIDNRSALLRTVLAGKRMLMLLDNARDTAHVRPLLPGSGSLVLVTSRSQLRSLTAREGARRVTLQPLGDRESADLLVRVIGDRTGAEPDAVRELARLCGGLPLALALAGERATREPVSPLTDLVGDLRSERDRLDALGNEGDPTSDLRAAFSWSYRALSPETAAFLRLLGIAPGPDISLPAAAALAAIERPDAQQLADLLARANLVQYRRPGRLEIHDLLRTYVIELADQHDQPADRSAALHRLLCWYAHTAFNARRHVHPSESTAEPRLGPDLVTPLTFQHGREALAWFRAECENLVAAVQLAYRQGEDDQCWRLAYALWTYFHMSGDWGRLIDTHTVGLRAAERSGEHAAQAHLLAGIGAAHRGAGRWGPAIQSLRSALELFGSVSDRAGEATVLANLSAVYRDLGQYDQSLDCSRRSYELDRLHGQVGNMAISLSHTAQTLIAVGRYDEAIQAATEALELITKIGHPRWQGRALYVLAFAHHGLGQHDQAIRCSSKAAAIFAEVGDPWWQASALVQLGDTLAAGGKHAAAHQTWRQAAEILEDLGAPDAALVRAKLGDRASRADR